MEKYWSHVRATHSENSEKKVRTLHEYIRYIRYSVTWILVIQFMNQIIKGLAIQLVSKYSHTLTKNRFGKRMSSSISGTINVSEKVFDEHLFFEIQI